MGVENIKLFHPASRTEQRSGTDLTISHDIWQKKRRVSVSIIHTGITEHAQLDCLQGLLRHRLIPRQRFAQEQPPPLSHSPSTPSLVCVKEFSHHKRCLVWWLGSQRPTSGCQSCLHLGKTDHSSGWPLMTRPTGGEHSSYRSDRVRSQRHTDQWPHPVRAHILHWVLSHTHKLTQTCHSSPSYYLHQVDF